MRVLQVRKDSATVGELTRGQAGELLTAGDKGLLELKPLKAFFEGEVRRGMMIKPTLIPTLLLDAITASFRCYNENCRNILPSIIFARTC